MPGPDVRGDAERAAEGRAERRADAGDLVLGLEGRDAEPLVLAQLVQDVGGRRDRVGAEEQRQPGLGRAGDQAVGQRQVAGDVAVGAGGHRRRLDLVLHRERLGGLAEVPARLERRDVGVADVGGLGEAALEERDRRLGGAAVHPGQQAEREHVLRAAGVLAGQPELLDRLDGHVGELDRVHVVRRERVVLERVLGVAGLGQVAGGEVVGVDDDRRALLDVREVGLAARPGSSRPARRGSRPASGCRGRRSAPGTTRRPGSVPWGARISAGKLGSVDRSLPKVAVSWVNRSPVSCMPSPESPANRMITRSSCLTCLVTAASPSFRGHGTVRPWSGCPCPANATAASSSDQVWSG